LIHEKIHFNFISISPRKELKLSIALVSSFASTSFLSEKNRLI